MTSVEQLYRQGALAADEGTQVVFVEGAANLVTGEEDRQRLQELLQTLEEKQKIVELLGAYLDREAGSGSSGDRTRRGAALDAESGADRSAGARGRRSDGIVGGDWADAH